MESFEAQLEEEEDETEVKWRYNGKESPVRTNSECECDVTAKQILDDVNRFFQSFFRFI